MTNYPLSYPPPVQCKEIADADETEETGTMQEGERDNVVAQLRLL